MKTVNEVALLSGISVRTLHYYDEIGLLSPAATTGAGYRLYGDAELARLQQILFFRELEFSLGDIRTFLDDPAFDARRALLSHRKLLLMKRDRLEGLIRLVDHTLEGENTMSFIEFDKSAIEEAQKTYAAEVKERWSGTDAYAESQKKTAGYTDGDWEEIHREMEEIYQGFVSVMDGDPAGKEAQALAARWQAVITARFYPCTDEILAGLGDMYRTDDRFRQNIDRRAEGLAAFMAAAFRHRGERNQS